jgi:hypothetical protein
MSKCNWMQEEHVSVSRLMGVLVSAVPAAGVSQVLAQREKICCVPTRSSIRGVSSDGYATGGGFTWPTTNGLSATGG